MLKAGGKEREGEGAKLSPIPTVEFILKLHPDEKKQNSCYEYTNKTMESFKQLWASQRHMRYLTSAVGGHEGMQTGPPLPGGWTQ